MTVRRLDRWGPLLAGSAFALIQYVLQDPFTVDDAAISYAYASSIAAGLPIDVVTAGLPAADGYSNPPWTFLLAGADRIGWAPDQCARVVGVVLTVLTVALVAHIAGRLLQHQSTRFCTVLVGASFTVALWAASGLETPLTMTLFLAAVALVLAAARQPSWPTTAGLSVVALLLALSRPEGPVYALAVIVALGVAAWRSDRLRWRHVATVSAVVAAGFGAYALWRLARFGHVLPTTVYAKVRPAPLGNRLLAAVNPLSPQWRETGSWLVGHGVIALVPLVLAGAWRAVRSTAAPLVVVALATLVLPLAELDWMAQYRFYAPVVPMLALLAALGAEGVLEWSAPRRRASSMRWDLILVGLPAALFVVVNVRVGLNERRQRWSEQVTQESIAVHAGSVAARLDSLGVGDPLIMTPDVGGAIFDHDLRVLDSAGLLDEQVALSRESFAALQRYVLVERRPDVIDTKPAFSYLWQLDEPTLANAGYVRISGVARSPGEPTDGLFIRRDLIIEPAAQQPVARATSGAALDRVDVPSLAAPGGRIRVRTSWSDVHAPGVVSATLVARGGAARATQPVPLGMDAVDPRAWPSGEAVRHTLVLDAPDDMPLGPATVEISVDGEVLTSAPVTFTATAGPTDDLGAEVARVSPAETERALLRISDQIDALPAARSTLLGIASVARARALSTISSDAEVALHDHDAARLVELANLAVTVRGRQQPAADQRALAGAVLAAHDGNTDERWLLARAALGFDPTNRDAAARLVDVRLAQVGTPPRPETDRIIEN